jgi:hypothetical protein
MLEGSGVSLPLFVRGNPHKTGDAIPRRFLEVFSASEASTDVHACCAIAPATDPTAALSPRLELAEQIVDPARTPITARVIVNRIWQHYFGTGLVASSDDFGRMGSEPSHPELLDWLAFELIEHDWSLKHIHRLILDSAAWRQASFLPPDATPELARSWSQAEQADPKNLWLHRMPVKRLEGEALRDAILSSSGRLDDRLYGRSVPVHLTEHHDGRGKPTVSGPLDGDGRRSLYIAVRRNFPDPLLNAFDFPVPSTTRGRRSTSNVPAQALALMNNPFVVGEAERFAVRILANRDGTPLDASRRDRIRIAFQLALSRTPTAGEELAAEQFLAGEAAAGIPERGAWANLCHALFNSKEFAFIP